MTGQPERVLAHVNGAHGSTYEIVRRLAGGYQAGAFLIRQPGCGDAVLKWSPIADPDGRICDTARLVAAARRTGWPTPKWLAVGTTPDGFSYQVQQFVSGTPADVVDERLLRVVLPIIELQADVRPATSQNWSRYDYRVVFEDESAYIPALRDYSRSGAAVAAKVHAATADYNDAQLTEVDLVHGDLNPSNILIDNGDVAAFIDVEAAGKGTRVHDLATIIVAAGVGDSSLSTLRRVLEHTACVARRGELEISLAAVLCAQLAFVIQHHPQPETILSRAASFLDAVRAWSA